MRLKVGENLHLTSLLVKDFNLLNGELGVSLAMLGELASEDSQANLELAKISAGHFDKNVLGVQGDLCCVRVYDWRKGQDSALGIVEDWELRLIFYDVQVLLKLLILLQYLKELGSIHLLSLLKSTEHDILRSTSFISNRSLHLIIIVGSH